MSFRINFVRKFIELNEKLIFNRRLLKFYKSEFGSDLKNVIDIGVNVGQTIELFLKINSECSITGFEPNPKLYNWLINKYKHNTNIKLQPEGISDKIGIKVFHENILHSTSTFETLNLESDYLNKKANILGVEKENIISNSYSVDVITLCKYINKNYTKDIDLIKIDTEGHEYYCLLGLFHESLKVKVSYIQIEEHNDDMYLNKKSFSDIKKLLNKNGYETSTRIKHGFGNFHEVIFKKIY